MSWRRASPGRADGGPAPQPLPGVRRDPWLPGQLTQGAPDGRPGRAASTTWKASRPGPLSEARESYYQRIITSRLYEALSPDARDVARRLAVSELPLPVDAVAKIVEAGAGRWSRAWTPASPLACSRGSTRPVGRRLYHPPGLLRPWLSDPERLPEQDAPRNRPPARRLLEVELRNGP